MNLFPKSFSESTPREITLRRRVSRHALICFLLDDTQAVLRRIFGNHATLLAMHFDLLSQLQRAIGTPVVAALGTAQAFLCARWRGARPHGTRLPPAI